MSFIQENRTLLEAYVGAVFVQLGMDAVMKWISGLVDPGTQVPYHNTEPDNGRFTKRLRSEIKLEAPPTPELATSPLVSPCLSGIFNTDPAYMTTPSTSGSSMLPSLPSNGSSKTPITFLPAFNQRCAKQHLKVDYHAENHGLPHAPRWVIRCLGECNQ